MTELQNTGATAPDLCIELAKPDDYAAVGDLVARSYLAAGYFDDPQHAYLDVVRQVADRAAHCEVFVARQQGHVVGTMTLIRYGSRYADIARPGELEIRMLAVDPQIQRAGVGRLMVQAAVERARALHDVDTVSLTTGADWLGARALYERLGFTHRQERDWTVPGTQVHLVVYTLKV
ncbi:GNAT family N-acetyltransferase [Glutamicibacter sp. PS]|uniref:GNAT family N-acetyltransferase n=1 Tax=Glutamicibacter sp. PS TaxID=3075634 RepID=UPI00284ABCF9|nr:GNAT family N-acetyltransferase [Glutamicibacter sp. PS]MDR4533545.1 GNAT family N-acetyltransferase [Glutamicibacter sp. PS]